MKGTIDFQYPKPARVRLNKTKKLARLARRLAERLKRRKK